MNRFLARVTNAASEELGQIGRIPEARLLGLVSRIGSVDRIDLAEFHCLLCVVNTDLIGVGLVFDGLQICVSWFRTFDWFIDPTVAAHHNVW